MTKRNQDIEIVAGDDRDIEFAVLDPNGAIQVITGASCQFVVVNPLDNTIEVNKSTGSGITITNGAGGIFVVSLAPADTEDLESTSHSLPIDYIYEAEVTLGSGKTYTVATGAFKVHRSAA